jgi:outer membrane protein assembly factor BamB
MEMRKNIMILPIVFLGWVLSLSAAEEKAGKEWPAHRGGQGLKGISQGRIGESLTLDWEFNTGEYLKSSVVVSGGTAFVGSETGIVFAISIENGKEVWRYKTSLGIDAPPLVHNGVLYVGSTDGFLYALNQEKGELIWKYETNGEIMGAANQAVRPKFNDSVLVVGSYDNFVHCISAKTGKMLWTFETQNYVNGVPTIYDDKFVVFGGCDSVLYVVGLEDGKLIRSVEVEAPIAASVSVSEGIGYVGNMDRAVMAFDLESGEIVWNYRQKNFPYFSSPAVTSTHVLIGGRDKGLHCINRISGKQDWRFSARGRIDSSPVVAHEKVIFGSMDGKLYILTLKDGKEVVSYEVGEPISSTPAVLDGRILVSCEDGNIYSFISETGK